MCKSTPLNIILTISVFLVVMCLSIPAAGAIIYVDADAIGANNGSSWADAYNYLQDALMMAVVGDEIWVAQGIYKPNEGLVAVPEFDWSTATFQLINGVAIRGGYTGLSGGQTGFGEPDPNARDIRLFETILSGDLDGNDVEINEPNNLFNEPTRKDNSNNVVTGSDTDETAVLDGFTITGAKSDGMYNLQGSPTLINCTFANNSNGIRNRDGCPALTNCIIENNEDCGIDNHGHGSPTLLNCTFRNNNRSGIENWGDNITLTNCTFENNKRKGIHSHMRRNLTLTNCTFENNGNNGIDSHGNLTLTNCTFKSNLRCAIDHSGGSLILSNCLFAKNSGFKAGGIDCWADELKLYNCTFKNNSARSNGGAISAHIHGGEFKVEDCVFSGNKANRGAGIEIWTDAFTISNCVFAGNVAERTGGALYCVSDYVNIRYCTFVSNTAGSSGNVVNTHGKLTATHSIFWDNALNEIEMFRDSSEATLTYCNVPGTWLGQGNINVAPCFVQPGYWADANEPNILVEPDDPNAIWIDGDYHLLSQAGRWDSDNKIWVADDVTSPCIDAGDPNNPIGKEPFPNGGRVNIGAYSASDKASKSYFGEPVCETIIAGDINGDCVVDFADLTIFLSHWMMQGQDFVNQPPIVILTEPRDGAQIFWPGPTIFRAEANDSDGEVVNVHFTLKYKKDTGTHTIGLGASDGTNGWEREYTWEDNAEQGNWTIRAEATDNEGAISVSPEIIITLKRQ